MSEHRITFILRLWRAPSAPPGEWRGEVEHVQGANVARFAELQAAFRHIQSLLTRDEQESNPANAAEKQANVE